MCTEASFTVLENGPLTFQYETTAQGEVNIGDLHTRLFHPQSSVGATLGSLKDASLQCAYMRESDRHVQILDSSIPLPPRTLLNIPFYHKFSTQNF